MTEWLSQPRALEVCSRLVYQAHSHLPGRASRSSPPSPSQLTTRWRGTNSLSRPAGDAIAIAAALAQPRASVVLSGAVTRPQLAANLAALTVGKLAAPCLAEPTDAYRAARAARMWH
jgi:aryl-alcohol dehydrogenase-like predicted oxidoreductase